MGGNGGVDREGDGAEVGSVGIVVFDWCVCFCVVVYIQERCCLSLDEKRNANLGLSLTIQFTRARHLETVVLLRVPFRMCEGGGPTLLGIHWEDEMSIATYLYQLLDFKSCGEG